MTRREVDDSYTNGSVVEVVSMEEGSKMDKEDDHQNPQEPDGGDVVVCGMPMSFTFLQMVSTEQHLPLILSSTKCIYIYDRVLG
jgi:hypothetical protein